MNALPAPRQASRPSRLDTPLPPHTEQAFNGQRPWPLVADAWFAQRGAPNSGCTSGFTNDANSVSASAPSTAWPQAILDELDYGILLVAPDLQLMLINRSARAELDEWHPLQLHARQLHTRELADSAALQDALLGATQRSLRRLLTLGKGEHRVSLAVVPLGGNSPQPLQPAMVILGKRSVCERLSVQWFAQCHGLTPAETRVLERLCAGELPRDIARAQGVGLATVRTQIGSIRVKTGAASIRELVQQVAVLPPMVNRLRPGGGG